MSFTSKKNPSSVKKNVEADLKNEGFSLNLASSPVVAFLHEKPLLVLISRHTPLPSVHRLICYHLLTNQTHVIASNVVVLVNTNALLFIDCCKLFSRRYKRSVVNETNYY